MDLLDIDYSRGFQCSQCGPYPSLVVMDGTALSFRKQFDLWNGIPIKKDEQIVQKGRLVPD